MTVGRLVHLESTVTIGSSSSASVTVPNDGSVVVGDLLLVGCCMSSGSRTFAISGGAGAWTSLTPAVQSGHTSEVWWRLAEAGDLGAVVTVTPSVSGIKQTLHLGKISGVDQTTPIAGSARATTGAITTKTTPSLGSVPAGAREISAAWDSRGASTPQTSMWTPPAGQTRQAQAFTIDTGSACSGAWGDTDSLVSGTIGSRAWVADQAALGSAWTIAVATADVQQTISPARTESTVSVPTPSVTPGAYTISPARINPTSVLYTPTLTPGPVTITPARLESGAVLFPPTVQPVTIISPARIESTAVVHPPDLQLGPITLNLARIESTAAVHTPELTGGIQTVTPAHRTYRVPAERRVHRPSR